MGQQERAHLITKIQKTFRSEEPPANIVYDATYADARMLELFLQGKQWTELTVEDIVQFKQSLSLLSSEGFHYYFPAFLIAALRDPHKTDTLVDSLVFVLGFQPSEDDPLEPFSDDSLEPFSIEERSLVREFLATYLDLFDEEYWHYHAEQLALLDKALKRWTNMT